MIDGQLCERVFPDGRCGEIATAEVNGQRVCRYCAATMAGMAGR